MDPDEAEKPPLARAPAHRAVGLARAAHVRARRHHARHGLRRGRRERLARARHGRGPRRRRRRSAPSASTVFSVSMTVVRIFGGPLVDRFGRVATLRVLAATATVGLLLFILAPSIPLVFVGAALWGAGVSLGFPLGMSAAADDPAKAAARVSAAATIGYISFLCGPPILGLHQRADRAAEHALHPRRAGRRIRPRLGRRQADRRLAPSAPGTPPRRARCRRAASRADAASAGCAVASRAVRG